MQTFDSCNSCGSTPPQVTIGENHPRQEWEYKVVASFGDQDLETALLELGKQGWSLVATSPAFIFKRTSIEENKPKGKVGFAVD